MKNENKKLADTSYIAIDKGVHECDSVKIVSGGGGKYQGNDDVEMVQQAQKSGKNAMYTEVVMTEV